MNPYIPHTEKDIKYMLDQIGVKDISDLFSDIPNEIIMSDELKLEKGKDEFEVFRQITGISNNNKYGEFLSFLGNGAYPHYIPAAVDYLSSRQEFVTAYTPYQPEISQGTLKIIYYFQTLMCELTGMQGSNASHYDGATALAESVLMASSATRKRKVLISSTIFGHYLKVVKTYCKFNGIDIEMIDEKEGKTDFSTITLDKNICGFVGQTPNKYGLVEDFSSISEKLHENKSLLIMSVNLLSAALFKSAGEMNADIVTGEAGHYGSPLSAGGNTLGFITTTNKLMRKISGRVVGETLDSDGKKAYVLTLQGREQHIRREKATSNITSNQALNALRTTIYFSLLGIDGLMSVAKRCFNNTHYLAEKLSTTQGIRIKYTGEFFNEFVIETDSKNLYQKLKEKGIILGYQLEEGSYLISTTEMSSKEDMDRLIASVKEVL